MNPDFFSITPDDVDEEYEDSSWLAMDRDLIHAKARRIGISGDIVGLWNKEGLYWRVSSGVGAVLFTPTFQHVSSGDARHMSHETFRTEFC